MLDLQGEFFYVGLRTVTQRMKFYSDLFGRVEVKSVQRLFADLCFGKELKCFKIRVKQTEGWKIRNLLNFVNLKIHVSLGTNNKSTKQRAIIGIYS